jgi:glucosamine--fructose-6-phosphate aminotransferase (isomerizing)
VCGIIATVGKTEAAGILLAALKRLTYRGYDSAGIVTLDENGSHLLKRSGKIEALITAHETEACPGKVGLGHTRWATHGAPNQINSHPHRDASGRYHVVCNGIIENYRLLKKELEAKGVAFISETDTEVLPALLASYDDSLDLKEKTLRLITEIKGSYAFVVMDSETPDTLWAARKGSPLLLARGDQGYLLGSDVPAILEHGSEVMYLKDGQMAGIQQDSVEICDFSGQAVEAEFSEVLQTLEQAEKEGYPHYMLKEIYEQADVVERTLKTYLHESGIDFSEYFDEEKVKNIEEVVFVACGTAYNASLIGQYFFESLGLRARAVLASEFHSFPSPVDKNSLVIAVSQSGETIDTLYAMRKAAELGAQTCVICNVRNSTLVREADMSLMMQAGIEIGVASTKAYSCMLTVIQLLGPWLSEKKDRLPASWDKNLYLVNLRKLPENIRDVLKRYDQLKNLLEKFLYFNDYFYIGRGFGLPTALEGALKLKEITYLHAEGYGAGEMKHGPIALIDKKMLTVALVPKDGMEEKMASNLEEIRARNGKIFMISSDDCEVDDQLANWSFRVPGTQKELLPSLTVIPLQILAYEVAVSRDEDPDQPRNLAKSVTVE